MGLPKITQLKTGRARIRTGATDSTKRSVANTTCDGENRQYQEPLSEFKTLRKWMLFLIQYGQAFFSFSPQPLL